MFTLSPNICGDILKNLEVIISVLKKVILYKKKNKSDKILLIKFMYALNFRQRDIKKFLNLIEHFLQLNQLTWINGSSKTFNVTPFASKS